MAGFNIAVEAGAGMLRCRYEEDNLPREAVTHNLPSYSVVFAMRYPDNVGYVWNNISAVYDHAATLLPPHCQALIAYPELTSSPAFVPSHLSRVQGAFYETTPVTKPNLAKLIQHCCVKTVVYMACNPKTIDLQWMRQLGIRTVSYEQDSFSSDARQSNWKTLAKKLVRRGLRWNLHSLYIANSEHQYRFLLDIGCLPSDRVIKVVNGVDTDRFAPQSPPSPETLGLPRTDHYAVMVCQARPEKRLAFLVDAATEVFRRQPDISLTFVHVGTGEDVDAAMEKVQSRGLQNRFVFAGFHNDVTPFLHLSSFLVHCAEIESFGLVLAEAMACGKPVLATDSTGPREIVSHRETGLIVGKDDLDAFVDGVIELSTNKTLRDAWGAASRTRSCLLFSLRRQAQEIAAALNDRGLS